MAFLFELTSGLTPVIPTAINNAPTFYKNGTAISGIGSPWLDPSASAYFILYPLPAPVLSTDVITVTAPQSWVSLWDR